MKSKFFMVLLLVITSSVALAEDYKFRFIYKGTIWDHLVTGNDKSSAFEVASQDCLNHFAKAKGQEKIRVDADTADALLDSCANPRQI